MGGNKCKQTLADFVYKSARICSNIFGDSVIQILKSGKAQESGLVSMSRQENVRIYFWHSLRDLKYDQKRFSRIPSSNVLEM